MAYLFIYQFSRPDGGKETIIFQDHKLNKEELKENTPFGTTLDQIIECDVVSGDSDTLPLDRELVIARL